TITGDLTNNSGSNLFGNSQGTVVLSSGSPQSINGNTLIRFNNLVLSNSIKTLGANCEVGGSGTGVLDIGNSVLDLNSKTLTILNPSSTSCTFQSGVGYVLSETDPSLGYGSLVRYVKDTVGPVQYVFPFGNGTADLRCVYDYPNGVASAGQIGVSTYPTNPSNVPNNRPLPSGVASLLNISGLENAHHTLDRYWIVSTSGFAIPSVPNITMRYGEDEWISGSNTISESSLQPQRNDFSGWQTPISSTINTANNTITFGGVSDFSGVWTLVGSNSPLPVSLLAFSGECNGDGDVVLTWTTASEVNCDYFTLERSANGTVFELVDRIEGGGTTPQLSEYMFEDFEANEGVNYYKLSQTDYDGTTKSLGLVVAKCSSSIGEITSFYNQEGEVVFEAGTGVTGTYDLRLFDAIGKLVMQSKLVFDKGVNRISIPVHSFEKGVYFMQLSNKTEGFTFKHALN
ncbi:MAG: hypothetical protein RL491_988, partial [Bacteroidota bacterium]